jgi:protein SCO1
LPVFALAFLAAGSGACSAVHAPAAERAPLQVKATRPHISLFRYPWRWTDELGTPGTLSRWTGVPLVITGIYAQCKSTCPRTIARLQKVSRDFRRDGRAAQFLLVTLDPDTDSPDDLLHYKKENGLPEDWHLLAGSRRDTQELTDVLDIHVLDDGPHLMHEAKIVLFDAAGMPISRFEGWALDQETPVL